MAMDGITAAQGRWNEILAVLAALSAEQLSNRHQPCPLCGGRDRYRFDDRQGSGSWFCVKRHPELVLRRHENWPTR